MDTRSPSRQKVVFSCINGFVLTVPFLAYFFLPALLGRVFFASDSDAVRCFFNDCNPVAFKYSEDILILRGAGTLPIISRVLRANAKVNSRKYGEILESCETLGTQVSVPLLHQICVAPDADIDDRMQALFLLKEKKLETPEESKLLTKSPFEENYKLYRSDFQE